MVSNAQKFQAAYNAIEAFLRGTAQYDQSNRKIIPTILELAKTNRVVREYQGDLVQLVELRNAIVHKSTEKPIAEPYDETVQLTESLRDKILRPKTAKDIAMCPVITFSSSDSLHTAITLMNNKNITNLPIVDSGGVLRGILSEASLVRWFAGEYDGGLVSTALKIDDISAYLDNPDDGREVVYRFVSRTVDVHTVADMYDDAIKHDKRLMAVFVTSNGKSTGLIEGIITPWDLANKV